MTEPEHEVPARPAFVLRVRADSAGTQSAWIDDERVAVPAGVDIHRALISAARKRADRTRPGSTIRVAGETADGSVFHLAIGPDGNTWEVPAPTGDDPDTVPDTVSHVVELQEADGDLIGFLDDTKVPLTPGEDPYEQLLERARESADVVSAGTTVRVLVRTPDGRVRHVALAPDGSQNVIPPVAAPAAGAAAAAPVNAFRPVEVDDEPAPQPAYVEDEGTDPGERPAAPTRLTDDLGRPIPTTTTQATAHEAFEPAAQTTNDEPSTAEAPAPEDTTGPSRRSLLLGGAGAIVLAGAATAGFFALRSDDSTPTPTSTVSGTPLPNELRPPGGLPASYLWSVVNMTDVAPQLAIHDEGKVKRLICTVDNDTTGGTQLISLDATTGKSQWKSDLPIDAVLVNGPALAPVDGTISVVLTSQNQIIVYPLSGGEPKTWPLQREWTVAITDSGVIVTRPDEKASAYVLHGDKLRKRAITKASNPVGLLRDGTLVATDAHGRVWLSKDANKAPKPKHLKAPRGTSPGTFVAATATQLVTAFVPRKDPDQARLRSFSLPDLKPRITTEPIEPAVFPNNFMLSPDETWAVGGNTWIDMQTGDSHVITARWSPIAISKYDTWSKSGDNILTANAKGKPLGPAKGSGGQVLVPRGGTAKVAYCVGSVGSDTTLYAVPLTDN